MKVFFTCTEDSFTGPLGSDRLYSRGVNYYTKQSYKPTEFSKKFTRFCSRLWQSFSELWFEIFEHYEEWDYYAQFHKNSKSGYNANLALNTQRMYPFFKNLEFIDDITSPPQIPDMPECLDAFYCMSSDSIVVSWLDNYCEETYIVGGYWRLEKYVNSLNNPPKIIFGEVAGEESFNVPGNLFSFNTSLWITIRSLNIRGEVSPWCPAVLVDLPDRPQANFTADPLEGGEPLEVQFTDTSTGFYENWLWEFGDGYFSYDKDPLHVYNGVEVYFSPRLTVFGAANSKSKKTRPNYIHLTEEEEYDTVIFICDRNNDRLMSRNISDFSFIAKIGSDGTGDDQFYYLVGVCADDQHVFTADSQLHRITKRIKSDLSFVSKVGGSGSGYDQFRNPVAIAVDKYFIYVADSNNRRIHIRNKSDLSLSYMITQITEGLAMFRIPQGIFVDDQYIIFTCIFYKAIIVLNKTTLEPVVRITTCGIPPVTLANPTNVYADYTHIYVATSSASSIDVQRYQKSDFSWVGSYRVLDYSSSAGPSGICSNGPNLFVSCPVLCTILKFDVALYNLLDTYLGPGSGDDELNVPVGLSIQGPFNLI